MGATFVGESENVENKFNELAILKGSLLWYVGERERETFYEVKNATN